MLGAFSRGHQCLAFIKEDMEMLVLSRKRGEVVVIGDSVTVTILEVRGNSVKLGFSAPAELPIRREEIRPVKSSREQDHADPELAYA